MTARFLHVGCGPRGRPIPTQFMEWDELRMDIDPTVEPDRVGSISELDLPDESVEGVYASHILEHVEQWDVHQALRECLRVLIPGGVAIIVTPDLLQIAKDVVDHPGDVEAIKPDTPYGPVTVLDMLFGYQPAVRNGAETMRHRTAFTQLTLAAHLQEAGFASAYVIAQGGQLCAVAQKGIENGKKGD